MSLRFDWKCKTVCQNLILVRLISLHDACCQDKLGQTTIIISYCSLRTGINDWNSFNTFGDKKLHNHRSCKVNFFLATTKPSDATRPCLYLFVYLYIYICFDNVTSFYVMCSFKPHLLYVFRTPLKINLMNRAS